MRTYNVKKQLKNDIIAGLAVAFLIVPQGLSCASPVNPFAAVNPAGPLHLSPF